MEKTKVLRETIGERFLLEDIVSGKGYLTGYVSDKMK